MIQLLIKTGQNRNQCGKREYQRHEHEEDVSHWGSLSQGQIKPKAHSRI